MTDSNHTIAMRAGHAAHVASSRERKRSVARDWEARVVRMLPRGATVRQVLSAYVNHLIERDSPSVKDTVSIIENYISESFGDRQADQLETAEVVAWVLNLRAWARDSGEIEETRVTQIHATLRAALGYAKRLGVLSSNPAMLPRGVLPKRGRRIDRESELMSAAELGAFLRHQSVPAKIRIVAGLGGLGGLREGEMFSRRLADIDMSRSPGWGIHVFDQWSRKNRRLQPPKGGRARWVAVHSKALQPLLEWWISSGWRCEHGRDPEPTDLLLARDIDGELTYLDDGQTLHAFRLALSQNGFRPRTIHSLRHTMISLMTDRDVPKDTIKWFTHPPPEEEPIDFYRFYRWPKLCEAIDRVDIDLRDRAVARSDQLTLPFT